MLATFDLAGHVIGLILERDLTSDMVDEIIHEIEDKLQLYEKVNVFIELEKGRKISLKALWEGIKYKYSNAERFGKIAIVTDSKSFQIAVDVSDTFLDVETRTYNIEDRLEAIQWISL